MNAYAEWRYDEYRQVGKDYGNPEEAAVYDETHADFRDVDSENEELCAKLALQPGDLLVDLGTGTGALPVFAAKRGIRGWGIDVSEAMLSRARERAIRSGVDAQVVFQRAGYLDFDLGDETARAAVSSFSLHHLPDFWKGVALSRIHSSLAPGGAFFLKDVALSSEGAEEDVNAFVRNQERRGGSFLREDALQHFREEFSTYDWVLEGLLQRAGFEIKERERSEGVIVSYLCGK
ncbi:class I SAM-dependent methyltransferase [Pelagicoccus sp. SDUM812003]|uniref:class I SAM-dependent methyltransferase n=1 Tax=Pelagicoccus sp. SDUM812003 TaxID=3041267 RepID=UPI00280E6FB0|nr:class I SAM-dependent methyltransferase [Pelagicoccus sp. SDUM812003]MDQ8203183.1 class I SAM-dependent methyltransferase [Pelagicoccus sp. SDUM812003]